MKILVINSGSSSLKYKLVDMEKNKVLISGSCERIGQDGSFIKHRRYDGSHKEVVENLDCHSKAVLQIKKLIMDSEVGMIKKLSEISAIGHRIVQGGDLFKGSVIIDDKVINGIKSLIPLAPLHNHAHIQGIKACIEIFGKDIPEVAVFDTSFHSTMPPEAYMFSVPYKYYEKYRVRRYGFHGISHRYVSSRFEELTGKSLNGTKLITCHLGNGSSITAIRDGKVIDTSMGFTPLDGFMMGTRTGSLDPSVVTFLQSKEGLSPEQTDQILNMHSGLLGISGISNDDRDITKAAAAGNKRAILAQNMFIYQIVKFIGSYVAALNGCDAIIFTAGIGENQFSHREKICSNFTYMGAKIDLNLNRTMVSGKEGKISSDDSNIDIFVIPTNEEWIIACETKNILDEMK